MPELMLARVDGVSFLTLAAVVSPDRSHGEATARLRSRVAALREGSLPMLDPEPAGETRIRSARPPRSFESAVELATARIRDGELEKIVLAREVVVEATSAHDTGALRSVARAVPVLLLLLRRHVGGGVHRREPRAAGAPERRCGGNCRARGLDAPRADPAVDDHLGEQLVRSAKDRNEHEIVARRIERTPRPHAVWVEAVREPELVRVANIQHLATLIHAQLAEPRSAPQAGGCFTHAGGGGRAAMWRSRRSRSSRGWTAVGTPVLSDGWTRPRTASCASRRAARWCATARLCRRRIVAGSDPAAELQETEVKLEALLPLLAG